MAHTPGPWVTNAINGQPNAVAIWTADQRKFICSTNGKAPSRYSVASELAQDANCRLIAAAPDLLAALKLSLTILEEEYDNYGPMEFETNALNAARAAIAKATGEAG